MFENGFSFLSVCDWFLFHLDLLSYRFPCFVIGFGFYFCFNNAVSYENQHARVLRNIPDPRDLDPIYKKTVSRQAAAATQKLS